MVDVVSSGQSASLRMSFSSRVAEDFWLLPERRRLRRERGFSLARGLRKTAGDFLCFCDFMVTFSFRVALTRYPPFDGVPK